MDSLVPAQLWRPWRLLRTRAPWAALLYVTLETLAGWITFAVLSVIVLLPGWLMLWPRIEAHLLPLSGRLSPLTPRTFRLQIRWRDWAITLLTPVAGLGGAALLGFGVAVPIALVVTTLRFGLSGQPGEVGFISVVDTPTQVVAILVAALLLTLGLWILTVGAHGWGCLMTSLLSDKEEELAEQVTNLSRETVRHLDRIALERRQLERDLHDGVQMHLGAAGMSLGLLQLDVEAMPSQADRRLILGSLEAVRGQLDAAATAVRTAAQGLVPPALRSGGLCAALHDVTDELPLDATVHCQAGPMDESTEVALYFIAAEALANTVRHADADHVTVDLRVTEQRIELDIIDDGRGGAEPSGTGLLSIQARASLLGGRAEVISPAGRGTTVSVRVPNDLAMTANTARRSQ